MAQQQQPIGQIVNNQVQAPGQLINQQQGVNGPRFTSYLRVPYFWWPTYKKSTNRDGATETVGVITAWSDTDDFDLAMLGSVTRTPPYLSRNLPEQHPVKSWLYATSVELVQNIGACMQGFSSVTLTNAVGAEQLNDQVPGPDPFIHFYDSVSGLDGGAVWEVTYAPRPYPLLTDAQVMANDAAAVAAQPGITTASLYEFQRFVYRDVYPAQQQITYPSNDPNYVWTRDGAAINAEISVPLPIQQVRYKWEWVPQTTVDNLLGTILLGVQGRINNAPFDIYPTGAMLCQSPQVTEPKFTPAGIQVRNLDLVFDVRADGRTWNHYYRKTSGQFEQVGANPKIQGAQPPYQSASFNRLFMG